MIGIKSPQVVIQISQREVLDFLKQNKGWFTARQISQEIGITHGSCIKNIYSLVKHDMIIRREHKKRYTFEYKYKEHEESMIRKKPLPVKELKEEYENATR